MRQRSLDEMITYFNQEIDKMDIDRRYKIALLGMVTAIGCTAKQTIVERKKGKWIDGSDERFVKCSKCGMETTRNELQGIALFGQEEPNYCPNCGADMRGDDRENDRR